MSSAFTYEVNSNATDSQQSSPGWMLTFVRWVNRDPNNFTNPEVAGGDLAVVDKPLVVVNDCVSLTVSQSKSSHTPQMTAMLRAGDINYMTAVAPGDFVFVNVVNWESDIDRLRREALAQKPINYFNDGFKGLFKVQSVRQTLQTDPATGAKQIFFQIDGFGFTEFNNMIYFNPHLIPPGSDKSTIFVTNLSPYWHSLFKGDGLPTVQDVNTFFIRTFLGDGVPLSTRKGSQFESATDVGKSVSADFNFNTHFYVPSGVGKLLGQNNAKAAKDLYVYLMGIQKYSAGTTTTPEAGFTPSNLSKSPIYGRFYNTNQRCQGRAYAKPDYWNQVPVWSIIKQYTNEPINEVYTCFRIAPNGLVMPTFVMRQIPFSSEKYSGLSTKFLNLPRWKVSPDMIVDINLGRDEALRVNFVQVFGIMTGTAKPDLGISYQIAQKNYVADEKDIKRSGLRPYIVSSNFDVPPIKQGVNTQFTNALVWKNLLGDVIIGQHLKLNGSIMSVGIQDPIAPGDNLELGDTVYHIESISHMCSVGPNGQKTFRTKIDLSNGVSRFGNAQKKTYSQMLRSKMALEQEHNYINENEVLPGIVDAETGYKDPFYDKNFRKNNRSFDLPPKTFGTPKKSSKSKKTVSKNTTKNTRGNK